MADPGVEIVNGNEPFALDEKRFYFPSMLKTTCPKCSAPYKHDFTDRYLDYPNVNKPIDVGAYCTNEDCQHEWTVKVRLKITLELV